MKLNTVNKSVTKPNQKKMVLAIAIALASSGTNFSSLAADTTDQKAVATANATATQENDLLTPIVTGKQDLS